MVARILLALVLGVWLVPLAASAQESATESPSAVVESLHRVLLDCMKRADELGFAGRYRLIAENLDQTFDMALMARIAIGKAWGELDDEQRNRWVILTRKYSASNYADKFDGYSDQVFQTRSEEPSSRGTVIVKTELVQKKDKDVKLDYRLRQSSAGWRIIDVQLGGRVSEIALRRADYKSVIGSEKDVIRGFDMLIARLSERIEELEGG